MFSIHGQSGVMYRGPIEDFRRVAPTLRLSRVRPLMVESERERVSVQQVEPLSPRAGSAQGLQAYSDVQQPPRRHPLHTVADVMSPQPVLLQQEASVQQGWALLREHGVGQAPVVDEQGQLVGLFTRAELLQPDHLPGPQDHALVWRAWLLRRVAEVMVTPVPGVSPDTDLRRLAGLLLDSGLPGVPVLDPAGRVAGFVSRTDILKALVHEPPLDLWAG